MLPLPHVQMSPLPYNILVSSTAIWEMHTGPQHSTSYNTYMLLNLAHWYLVVTTLISQDWWIQTGVHALTCVTQNLISIQPWIWHCLMEFQVEFQEQSMVATSSTEAEYITSCHGAKEAVWLQSLLKFLGHAQSGEL